MANGDPVARMLQVMERQGERRNGYQMTIAKVKSVAPLQIVEIGRASCRERV